MVSDADLVRQARAGRTTAYEELVRRWAGRITALCHARVKRAHLADELAQETLLRGFRALHTLTDPERFGVGQLTVGGRHQAVVCLLDLLRGTGRRIAAFTLAGWRHALGVLAELMALVADLDEPGVLGGPVPGMIWTHEQFSRFHG